MMLVKRGARRTQLLNLALLTDAEYETDGQTHELKLTFSGRAKPIILLGEVARDAFNRLTNKEQP